MYWEGLPEIGHRDLGFSHCWDCCLVPKMGGTIPVSGATREIRPKKWMQLGFQDSKEHQKYENFFGKKIV